MRKHHKVSRGPSLADRLFGLLPECSDGGTRCYGCEITPCEHSRPRVQGPCGADVTRLADNHFVINSGACTRCTESGSACYGCPAKPGSYPIDRTERMASELLKVPEVKQVTLNMPYGWNCLGFELELCEDCLSECVCQSE